MTIQLSARNSKASLNITPQGAHITSWKDGTGKEQLFLSEKAVFAPSKAIRGGVPIIFPQFGAFGDGQKHGFARISQWTEVERSESKIIFALQQTAQSSAVWPHRFNATFSAEFADDYLLMKLTVDNTGDDDFSFTAALHTYFLVENWTEFSLEGLQSCHYWDNGEPREKRTLNTAERLEINSAIDRVYFASAARTLVLHEKTQTRTIKATGFNDTVVWNPGPEGAAKLADMHDDEYRHMICIESAIVEPSFTLGSGKQWQGSQTIQIL